MAVCVLLFLPTAFLQNTNMIFFKRTSFFSSVLLMFLLILPCVHSDFFLYTKNK